MSKYILFFFLLIIIIFSLVNCPKPDSDAPEPTAAPTNTPEIPHIAFSFEADTDIGTWVYQGDVYVQGEGGATNGSCGVSTEQVKSGTQSLKVMGTLGNENDSYSAHEVRIKLDETLGIEAQDFTQAVIAVSVYVPPAPAGGGDYIQFVLHNSDYDNVQSTGFGFTESEWNVIVFDIGAYTSGSVDWGYDTTEGSPETVYTAVTEIGVKVGFATGPDRDYSYYIDDLYADQHSLRVLAAGHGLFIGAAVDPDHLNETDYDDTLKTEFNMMVAENVMKMGLIQPTEGNFNFTGGDAIIAYAEANTMEVRGHALLWHSQTAAWMEAKPYSELLDVLQSHIDTVVTHYQGDIHSWDVVNEVIKDDGTGLRNNNETPGSSNYSIWADSPTDDALIKEAFNRAHTIDPDALLFINDYSNDTMGQTKADALYTRIDSWVGEGVPIDGVGFQLHVAEEYTPDYTNIRANIDRYIALGLQVQFTEIDVRIQEPITQDKIDNQAVIYDQLMQIALDYPEVTCFVTWGVSDKYSWIPTFFAGYDAALLFDEEYIPKTAYWALVDLMD